VILVDTNLLVYGWNEDAPEHPPARRWLEARLNGVEGVGLPWASLLGFTRIVTNPRIFERAAPVADAWAQVDEWLALHNVFTPEPTVRHAGILHELLAEADRSAHVPDAHLAALAIEYGLTLQTTDRDFARFSGLKWENPLGPTHRG
jgi:toxin-antitoxin system PIN domain toxin